MAKLTSWMKEVIHEIHFDGQGLAVGLVALVGNAGLAATLGGIASAFFLAIVFVPLGFLCWLVGLEMGAVIDGLARAYIVAVLWGGVTFSMAYGAKLGIRFYKEFLGLPLDAVEHLFDRLRIEEGWELKAKMIDCIEKNIDVWRRAALYECAGPGEAQQRGYERKGEEHEKDEVTVAGEDETDEAAREALQQAAKAGSIMTVGEVADEYEWLRTQRCECGGRYERESQHFFKPFPPLRFLGEAYDVLHCRCIDCARERFFCFEVSQAFNAYDKFLYHEPRPEGEQ